MHENLSDFRFLSISRSCGGNVNLWSPLATLIPTHFEDATHFKHFLETIPSLPPNAFLVTADIVSLYTNIPIDVGISRVCDFISPASPRPHPEHQRNVFRIILDHILKDNSFSFLDKYYLQILGTAMVCRMAPPYANLFLHHLLHPQHKTPDTIHRRALFHFHWLTIIHRPTRTPSQHLPSHHQVHTKLLRHHCQLP